MSRKTSLANSSPVPADRWPLPENALGLRGARRLGCNRRLGTPVD